MGRLRDVGVVREVQPTPRADCEDVVLLHEPGRYPVAYFPLSSLRSGVLEASGRTTRHRELGETSWFTVGVGSRRTERAYDRLTPACAGRTQAQAGSPAASSAYPRLRGEDLRLANGISGFDSGSWLHLTVRGGSTGVGGGVNRARATPAAASAIRHGPRDRPTIRGQ
ncbi:DUF427 domain-containing protein [Streptomyces mirabilis]|uniref:DUF427 domain-containing protein n=1 Tax=Streptomyces mirabilis TaxID=68239 RepID=UPI0033FA26D1